MKKGILLLGILGSFFLTSCDSRKAETNDNSQNSSQLESEGEMDHEASSATGSGGNVNPEAPGAGVEEGAENTDSTVNKGGK